MQSEYIYIGMAVNEEGIINKIDRYKGDIDIQLS